MSVFAKETLPISLETEMRRSYLDYAMSVIVGRALPDVRDGLKPVHRRVLYAMHELSNAWNRPYKKSARIVGDVIGKYHPHGDQSVYDTIVRMAQDFSLRYMLVDGQGNFGSVDGDNAAAMRYTEIRLSKIAHEMLADIDKETVDFGPNYDGSEQEPLLLPARLPNLLINGSSGIAVGMATNIPPHNLGEVLDACLHLLRNPGATIEELMERVPAPDFPTAGIIYGTSGVRDAYRTGRGRVVMRARCHFEDLEKGQRQAIIVDELPYQVNKRTLLERIAELVQEKKIEGISHIQDESDKSGMRVVIELKRGEVPEVVLNNLYKQTQLQDTFGVNMVALVDGQPRLLNLQQMIAAFLSHRREIITRRTVFDLRKARERGHVLEGLAVALANVDRMIELIKAAPTPPVAKERLLAQAWEPGEARAMLSRVEGDITQFQPDDLDARYGLKPDGYYLSETQAQEILQMRLQRLTGLEQDKIVGEYKDVMEQIADLLDILAKPERMTEIITTEMSALRAEFGDARRSHIEVNAYDIDVEDLITPQDLVVTISHSGYVKSQPLAEYRAQRRGGRGKLATGTKEDDWVEQLFVANTHDMLLCFSNRGRVYWMKVYESPMGGRGSRGKPLVNLFPLQAGEKITTVLPVKAFDEQHYVFMATARGTVKKTPLTAFVNRRTAGIIAVALDEDDYLIGAAITDGQHDVMLFSDAGKAVRFDEADVRPMGREARGVRGMQLEADQSVIALLVAEDETQSVLTATENGYGKRTSITEYTRHGRGTKGMIAIQTSERNGKVVAACLVRTSDEIMLITDTGVLVRTRVEEIREMGRATQGVTLIALDAKAHLIQVQPVVEADDDELPPTELPPAEDGGADTAAE
ncbi:DNA gyrase (type II topoisomerase), subunit A [Thiomonas arsenitoxydans]|uniref:DNA gyrase subunit A n=1 Tax=Thiomonas arsenitoxydans (strain DSM 22701 / CIP 110005 / 3As) TaxID=426114 RepID=D6CUI0_THIA3|nr:DNA gyrase subunit A [Thiomonas arsenitoxydans]CAZ88949.1 DNA gyrase subunit A [Thiomonas arsenitoxydans]CQR29498.1 DNA gyrase (type II topoisomerase), subunit A [Thiomonas arsenitoxydans]CQR34923.1 DNA gyrase (type II topoisomerase), subunit A [Thiomonas arsenitoxydans]CQR35897.1 DNA gyrase (type II topoisomerase), subunit A [Thiomonas arsenitoxydans]CQR35993.1 DNA gyrase (type II topoisomerase), subunit A [Thiomonas arsenitoxydans]